MEESQPDIAMETPPEEVFVPPSIHLSTLVSGASYTHYSDVPPSLLSKPTEQNDAPAAANSEASTASLGPPCALGVDEAGRGPVLGPMVYGTFYLPLDIERPLLADTHHFDDSKVLTPAVRSNLMEKLCTQSSDLFAQCGWAVNVMSARDISSNMLKPVGVYNLNAQAMDATISLIRGVYERGVNVKEIYIDTIGNPATYQAKLEKLFPSAKVTVAKKADSLFPCVSAASVCAKVTRDAALEKLYEAFAGQESNGDEGWGSGYPSDVRCTGWMKRNMDPVFGWGSECRFSWGTSENLLEAKGAGTARVDWPKENEEMNQLSTYFDAGRNEEDQLASWFGSRVNDEVF